MLVLLEQTNYCNLRCNNCPNRLAQRPRGYMTPEIFKSTIDQLLEHNESFKKIRLALHGVGEPFLSPHLWKNLDYLQEKGFVNVDFSTNGLAMTKAKVDELVKYKCLSWVRVSLNSSRKELMERINTGSDFDLVVKHIKYLVEAVEKAGNPFNVVLQRMITRKNEDEGKDDYVKLIGSDKFKYMEKRLHTYHHQTEDTDLSFPDIDQSTCVFGGIIFSHWDGDLVGCCVDDTKTQVYGKVKDGIFSKGVLEKKKQFNEELQKREFKNLPFCKKCLGL